MFLDAKHKKLDSKNQEVFFVYIQQFQATATVETFGQTGKKSW